MPPRRLTSASLLIVFVFVLPGCLPETDPLLGSAEHVAKGIALYRVNDPTLLDPPGPIAIQILVLDPARVELRSALARDRIMNRETVLDMAERHRAAAAINAGFFAASGDPTGILKLGGLLVSDTTLARGAVGVRQSERETRLLFDRVSVTAYVNFRDGPERHRVRLDALDAPGAAGKLILYTPRYGAAFSGERTEWTLKGAPLKIVSRLETSGDRTEKDSLILSYGAGVPPPPLEKLTPGTTVEIAYEYATAFGTAPRAWLEAREIVGGAGLLMLKNRLLDDWTVERLAPTFMTSRHPRTVIGVGPKNTIWLITIDGRQPEVSLGMNFEELRRLTRRLKLRSALNLDGGGSTTMVVKGRIVNHPSDPTGPRPVSDALLVFTR